MAAFNYCLLLGLGLVGAVLLPACASGNSAGSAPKPGIEVLALSRGRGVPDVTYEAFVRIATLAREAHAAGRIAVVERQTIGLEGESRLCLEFDDMEARDALLERIRQIAAGIDLLAVNLKECSRNKDEQ